MSKRRKHFELNEPLRHRDHSRPVTRREFIRQGFLTGSAYALAGGVFSLFADPRAAMADVSSDLNVLASGMTNPCALGGTSSMVPFICFDLAGGANLAGSNVLVGKAGGQLDLLTTAGYSKLGLPGDIIPGLSDTALAATMLNPSDGNFVNSLLGLRFHSDSAMLRGILEKFSNSAGRVDGVVIPARSDNDTGNNPHNPLYLLAKMGVGGKVVPLIGSVNSVSGGNSMSPAAWIDPKYRPTKVDRPTDVTGMIDVGNLTAVLNDPKDVTAVMESMARISHKKIRLGTVSTGTTRDEVIKDLVECGYIKTADVANRFAGEQVDPRQDVRIIGGTDPNTGEFFTPLFTSSDFNDGEFSKTASVMKMVVNGYSGAGCITMGGFDYHTGDRSTGENRDLRAGRCIGACLEYALRRKQPLMIYVFSDGALSSSGALDNSMGTAVTQGVPAGTLGGRGKGEWTSDNESTACSFILVYKPNGGISVNSSLATGKQIGWFSGDGSVVSSSSPAANNVNLLVNTVVANYMSLQGSLNTFTSLVPNHGLGSLNNVLYFV
jgi:hypothetical protein